MMEQVLAERRHDALPRPLQQVRLQVSKSKTDHRKQQVDQAKSDDATCALTVAEHIVIDDDLHQIWLQQIGRDGQDRAEEDAQEYHTMRLGVGEHRTERLTAGRAVHLIARVDLLLVTL